MPMMSFIRIYDFPHRLFSIQPSAAVSLLIVFIMSSYALAQDTPGGRQLEIIQAGSLEGVNIGGKEVRRLVGDVIFQKDSTRLYCDSALFYEEDNSIDAYGRIRIEGKGSNLFGEFLHYDGPTRTADITGRVVRMTDGKMELTTRALRYDMEQEKGSYVTGGKVVDKDNVLTSRKGYYHALEKNFYFREDVVLVNPDYVMNSDTLRYHSPASTAYFYGPTRINSTGTDSGRIYCERGWYNTENGRAWFGGNASITSGPNRLTGDSILYSRSTGRGQAWNNVAVRDSVEEMSITGDYGWLDRGAGKSYVTGKSRLVRKLGEDSLFLHADTLYAMEDTVSGAKSFFAWHYVRMYSADLQGQCDSLVYSTRDSSMRFFNWPVLWSGANQLTADTVILLMKDNNPWKLEMHSRAFIAGREDSLRYNQVKGRSMTGWFNENRMETIMVNGNGQSVYYLRNAKKQLSAANQAACSDMRIRLKGSKVDKITLLNRPDATLYPVKQVDPQELKLKDFVWFGHLQPLTRDDIFLWPGEAER